MKTSRPVRSMIGAGTAAALVGAALVAGNLPATGAPTPGGSADCPVAHEPGPGNKLAPGLRVTGKTTAGSYTRGSTLHSSPTTPEEFEGVYLDTVEDAFGDLHIFQLSGSRITNTDGTIDAGIWAGISGSPVYDADGKLVGSVSYSFSGYEGTTFAGVTPAADLYGLLAETDTPPATITLNRQQRQALQRAGVPAAATRSGLKRLTGPVVVTGVRGISDKLHRALAKKADLPVVPQSLAGSGHTQSQQIPVVAGGNVAVAASYGAVALYSVGTATAVCDDVVIGYGHPDSWAPSTSTIHGASTVVVVADGPNAYKLANLGGPVGTLLTDRMGGITGRIGALPPSVPVNVTTTGPKGPRTSETAVTNLDALSYVVATQLANDAALVLDENAAGTADLSWTISFEREDGTPDTFERTQTYASTWSVPEEVSYDVASDVEALLDNGFEDVTITDVTVTQEVSREYRSYSLGRVETNVGGGWQATRNGERIKVKPGKKVKVRVQLVKADRKSNVSPVTRTFTFATPAKAAGRGSLQVSGNGASLWDFEDFFFEEIAFVDSYEEPTDLDSLLELLEAKRQDTLDVTTTAPHPKKGEVTKEQTWSPGAVVTGDFYATLKFTKAKKGKKAKG